jgi:hypothetical protein
VRFRKAPAFNGFCQNLSVDPICLSAVLSNAQLLASRRIDEQHLVAPPAQELVGMPRLATRLYADLCCWLLGAKQWFQALQTLYRGTLDDLTIANLAETDLLSADIYRYTSHWLASPLVSFFAPFERVG